MQKKIKVFICSALFLDVLGIVFFGGWWWYLALSLKTPYFINQLILIYKLKVKR